MEVAVHILPASQGVFPSGKPCPAAQLDLRALQEPLLGEASAVEGCDLQDAAQLRVALAEQCLTADKYTAAPGPAWQEVNGHNALKRVLAEHGILTTGAGG